MGTKTNDFFIKNAENSRILHPHICCLLLNFCAVFVFVFPSFSDPDIANNVTTPYCDDSVLESDTGPVNIEINWEPNEIDLHWYNVDTEITSGVPTSCIYDAGLSPPQTIPTREGYTFTGWRVLFDLSKLTGTPQYRYSHCANCFQQGAAKNCSLDVFADLALFEWKVVYSSGSTVYGVSACGTETGTYRQSDPSSDTGGECWCKATGYKPNGENTTQNVVPTAWVWNRSLSRRNCLRACGDYCVKDILGSSTKRANIYKKYIDWSDE